MIVWLDVPFSEKDEAKKRGALWSAEQKKWFANNPKSFSRLLKWMSKDDRRAFGPGRSIGELFGKSLTRSFQRAVERDR